MGEDFDFNLVIVALFLIMGAIRWVVDHLKKGSRPPHQEQSDNYSHPERPEQAQTRDLDDLYEEARREILNRQNKNTPQPEQVAEKLSEYSTPPNTPPPPVPERARFNRPALPPKTPATPAPPLSYSDRKVERPKLSAAEEEALAAFQTQSLEEFSYDVRPQKKSSDHSRVKALLRSPSAARDAMVLTEILGKPKGLR